MRRESRSQPLASGSLTGERGATGSGCVHTGALPGSPMRIARPEGGSGRRSRTSASWVLVRPRDITTRSRSVRTSGNTGDASGVTPARNAALGENWLPSHANTESTVAPPGRSTPLTVRGVPKSITSSWPALLA